MNILLLGANGQVGWELQRALAPLGTVHVHDRRTADLSQPQSLHTLILALRPAVIVNAGAYTAVDKAESEPTLAHAINAQAPAAMAKAALEVGALLVHYSTDYVFDGAKVGAYLPQDETAPKSVYGTSKLAGEQAIVASGCAYLIFRTSWVYARRGGNFAKTMLKLAQTRESLAVVSDQIGAPTGADLIADVSAHCIAATLKNPALLGLYHLVSSGQTSWHGYAQFALRAAQTHGAQLKVTPEQVQAISTAQYPTAATRPANSWMDTSSLRTTFGLNLPPWEQGVTRLMAEISA